MKLQRTWNLKMISRCLLLRMTYLYGLYIKKDLIFTCQQSLVSTTTSICWVLNVSDRCFVPYIAARKKNAFDRFFRVSAGNRICLFFIYPVRRPRHEVYAIRHPNSTDLSGTIKMKFRLNQIFNSFYVLRRASFGRALF